MFCVIECYKKHSTNFLEILYSIYFLLTNIACVVFYAI